MWNLIAYRMKEVAVSIIERNALKTPLQVEVLRSQPYLKPK